MVIHGISLLIFTAATVTLLPPSTTAAGQREEPLASSMAKRSPSSWNRRLLVCQQFEKKRERSVIEEQRRSNLFMVVQCKNHPEQMPGSSSMASHPALSRCLLAGYNVWESGMLSLIISQSSGKPELYKDAKVERVRLSTGQRLWIPQLLVCVIFSSSVARAVLLFSTRNNDLLVVTELEIDTFFLPFSLYTHTAFFLAGRFFFKLEVSAAVRQYITHKPMLWVATQTKSVQRARVLEGKLRAPCLYFHTLGLSTSQVLLLAFMFPMLLRCMIWQHSRPPPSPPWSMCTHYVKFWNCAVADSKNNNIIISNPT